MSEIKAALSCESETGGERQMNKKRKFCVDVFLAVNHANANEAWSVILLQLISVNPQPKPGHCSCTQACLGEKNAHSHWLLYLSFQTMKL